MKEKLKNISKTMDENEKNILKTISVFGLGTVFFPNHIRINSNFTLILVLIAFFGLDMLFVNLNSFLINNFKYSKIFPLISIFIFVTGFLYFPVKIGIMERFIPGFSISGNLTLLILWFLFSKVELHKNQMDI